MALYVHDRIILINVSFSIPQNVRGASKHQQSLTDGQSNPYVTLSFGGKMSATKKSDNKE